MYQTVWSGAHTKLSSNMSKLVFLSSFFRPFEDLRNYTMTLSALEKSKQWQWALELLSEMSHKSLKPDLTLDQTWRTCEWSLWHLEPPNMSQRISSFLWNGLEAQGRLGTERCHFKRNANNHYLRNFEKDCTIIALQVEQGLHAKESKEKNFLKKQAVEDLPAICHQFLFFDLELIIFGDLLATSSFARWRGRSIHLVRSCWRSVIGLPWSSMFGLLATEHPCWVYTADVCNCSKDMPQHRLGLDDFSWMFAVKCKGRICDTDHLIKNLPWFDLHIQLLSSRCI